LWVEACNTDVYLQNKSPHQILGMSTPDFLRKKPEVEHFHIFYSSVYYHVNKYAWKKLEPIYELGIFVGYTNTTHNYRVYLPTNRMTLVHRDVKFDEENSMRCSLEREL